MSQTHKLLLTRVILLNMYMCIIIAKALKLCKAFCHFSPTQQSEDYIQRLHFHVFKSNLTPHKCAAVLTGNSARCFLPADV